jgi:hypothetical protein
MDQTTELIAKRFKYLKALYDETAGDLQTKVDMWQLGDKLGLNRKDTASIKEYLLRERLLNTTGFGMSISISHTGIKEVEKALTQSEQGTASSTQTQQIFIGHTDLKSLVDLLQQLKVDLHSSHLNSDNKREAAAEIATVEAQASSSRPKSIILKESISTLRDILQGAEGNLAAEYLPRLLHYLPH